MSNQDNLGCEEICVYQSLCFYLQNLGEEICEGLNVYPSTDGPG